MTIFLKLLATMFGVGQIPKAPGTAGSFVALVLGAYLMHFMTWQIMLGVIVALFLIGIAAANAHEKLTGVYDSPKVVIDEWVGMWIVLLPLEAFGTQLGGPMFIYDVLVGFALFRLFDIWKPFPVSWGENLGGGLGVMADDIIAGIMAALVLMGLGYLI